MTKGHKMLAGPALLWLLSFLQTPECGLALSLSHTQPLLGTGGQAGLREPPRQHHTCSRLVSFLLSFYATLETLAGLILSVLPVEVAPVHNATAPPAPPRPALAPNATAPPP